jgi:hypothetical protein
MEGRSRRPLLRGRVAQSLVNRNLVSERDSRTVCLLCVSSCLLFRNKHQPGRCTLEARATATATQVRDVQRDCFRVPRTRDRPVRQKVSPRRKRGHAVGGCLARIGGF